VANWPVDSHAWRQIDFICKLYKRVCFREGADQIGWVTEMLYTNWLLAVLWQLCFWLKIMAFDYCDPVLCPGPEKHIACNNFGVSGKSFQYDLVAQ